MFISHRLLLELTTFTEAEFNLLPSAAGRAVREVGNAHSWWADSGGTSQDAPKCRPLLRTFLSAWVPWTKPEAWPKQSLLGALQVRLACGPVLGAWHAPQRLLRGWSPKNQSPGSGGPTPSDSRCASHAQQTCQTFLLDLQGTKPQ